MNLNAHEVTEITKQILANATNIAAGHRSTKTDVRHVILALCTDPESVASIGEIVRFDPDRIHHNIELGLRPGDEVDAGNALAFTAELENVLDVAAEIASTECGCEFMAPHHLLLGILKAADQGIVNTLAQYDLTFDALLSACKAGAEVPANAS
jgi:ATP-dependent Clp protease ATP-binding subunit ClpA